MVKLSFLLLDMLIVKFTTKRPFQIFCLGFVFSIPHFRPGIRVYGGMPARIYEKERNVPEKKKPRKRDLTILYILLTERQPALHSTGTKNIPCSLFCSIPK